MQTAGRPSTPPRCRACGSPGRWTVEEVGRVALRGSTSGRSFIWLAVCSRQDHHWQLPGPPTSNRTGPRVLRWRP